MHLDLQIAENIYHKSCWNPKPKLKQVRVRVRVYNPNPSCVQSFDGELQGRRVSFTSIAQIASCILISRLQKAYTTRAAGTLNPSSNRLGLGLGLGLGFVNPNPSCVQSFDGELFGHSYS
jgi:hypothetical protein